MTLARHHQPYPADGVPVFGLQDWLTPLPDAPQPLYFAAGSMGFDVREPVESQPGLLPLQQRCSLNLNSYFNAFFLDYWRVHTGIMRLAVHCVSTGAVQIRAVAHGANAEVWTLLEWTQAAGDDSPVWIWDRMDDMDGTKVGRIHLEITALTKTRIDLVRYVTDVAPSNAVTLAIGLCTFDREALFEKTLEGLHALSRTTPALRRVHVINQGRSFVRPGLTTLLTDPIFSVIEQANLGGCGGFTRAMVEASESEDHPTHLLIMDDDIVLDPRVIARLITFARYALVECAIGGQALELESRLRLHQAGERLGPNWTTELIGKDADLGEAATLDLWTEAFDVDYNAWWLCLIPISAIRRCGLPAPIFLHGDDIEYGVRLKEAGVPTISLPGIGVWHASFRYKHAGPLQYYDLRNLLINASAHPAQSNLPSPIYVFGWVMTFLLVHRYRAAMASMIAIADFLDGPTIALGPDGCTRNVALRKKLDRLPPPDLRIGVVKADYGLAPKNKPASPLPRQAMIYLAVFLHVLLRPSDRRISMLVKGFPIPENTMGAAYLLAMGPKADRCLELRPHRLRLLGATGRAVFLGLRYSLLRHKAARQWAESMPALRSRTRWAQEFSCPRE